MKSTADIRKAFLDYFASQEHEVVTSSSLVPANDPTLLFTNAGMVQFKDVFLGAEKRANSRATSSQRCVRAGGKHNDLDQVGYTARHHTFFEMLGNFSFGDYFKTEAIRYSWDLLTEVYGLPKERLWVTVYETDDEAYQLWKDMIGVPEERIIRIGDKPGGRAYESDNFWAMGDTGPCGPCTEIFYDHGSDVAGGPPGSPDEDGDRYIEIWNLVFMQFDRAADGSMNPLPKPCVDTGMGLERIAAVLQHVHSNYEIDLFQSLIKAAADITGCKDVTDHSLKVIADHIRACSFLIVDGVIPSNEGRGYVLRRIIRRAIRHGHKLGQKEMFFHRMVKPLVAEMGEAYPELKNNAEKVEAALLDEERRFAKTLETGMSILGNVISKHKSGGVIDGETAFLLYDTYGFPLDLTQDVAREHQLTVDTDGFDQAMERQRQQAKASGKFQSQEQVSADAIKQLPDTVFLGYESLSADNLPISGILVDGQLVNQLQVGEQAILVLGETPFYAESGGQVGDTGWISNGDGRFQVTDTIKLAGTFHGHVGKATEGELSSGAEVSAVVDAERRQEIVLHHSATHLLHAALRQVLGEHVIQKGSLVAPDRLRFDFSHPDPVTPEQLHEIERLVNREIRLNPEAQASVMGYDDAIRSGAMALFGEKYGDQVRVLRFGDFSVELCGGTHVHRVGDIGQFKIIAETGIAAGVRRVEAVAGEQAVNWIQNTETRFLQVAELLKAAPESVTERIEQLLERSKVLEKDLSAMKSKLASASGDELSELAKEINGIRVVSAKMDGLDAKGLRDTVDQLKNKLGSAVILLASVEDTKIRLAAGVSDNLTSQLKAGDLVNFVAKQVGGRGGGRPDFAQAGGDQPENLEGALAKVEGWVESYL